MKGRGWRRIGVVLSVIWFLGFGVFLWHLSVEDAVAPIVRARETCYAIDESNNEFWRANARNSEELGKKLEASSSQLKKCISEEAEMEWERTRHSDSFQFAWVLGVDLVTIALSWLMVWGCVAVVRWVRRGFVVWFTSK